MDCAFEGMRRSLVMLGSQSADADFGAFFHALGTSVAVGCTGWL